MKKLNKASFDLRIRWIFLLYKLKTHKNPIVKFVGTKMWGE